VTDCTHRNIQAWSYPDGPADFWSCADCKLKFVPITREIELERELAAARAELLEQARINGMGGERELKLMAELAAARADAVRYRWLRDSPNSFWRTQNPDAAPGLESRIDAHIDEEMAKEPTDG